MKWIRDLKIGARLVLGFSVMILLMLVIGFSAYRSTRNLQNLLDEILRVRLPSIDYLTELEGDLQKFVDTEWALVTADIQSSSFQELLQDYQNKEKLSGERWEKYKALARTPEEQAIISRYEKDRDERKTVSNKLKDRNVDAGERRRLGVDLTLGDARKPLERMRDSLKELHGINISFRERAQGTALAIFRSALVTLLAITGVGLFLALFLIWAIRRGVTKPLKTVIQGLTVGAEHVSAASGQVSQASQQVAQGSSQQASGIEETSSSLEEIASMTRQNAGNADEANRVVAGMADNVTIGKESMERLRGAVEEIKKSSDATSKIVKSIDDIAFQTNLLALNAAVEAARAGDAGKGFAVVAEEVRNLAKRAGEAARNTATLIEGAVKKADQGVSVASETEKALKEVTTSVQKVSGLIAEITAATKEQSQGIDQVSAAVAQMNQVTQANAANAEESASASEELNAQVERVNSLVQELWAIVGGTNGAHGRANQGPKTAKNAVADLYRNTADLLLQRPRGGRGQGIAPKTVKTKRADRKDPKKVIPFGDEDPQEDEDVLRHF